MYIQKYEGKDASISILKHKSRKSIIGVILYRLPPEKELVHATEIDFCQVLKP